MTQLSRDRTDSPNPIAPRKWVLGVIGGSGLYEIDGLEDRRWVELASPWGASSDAVLHGMLEGVEVRFLPRHGRGHRLSPSHLNYRANIDVLKRAGVTDILSISAVGSLREALAPGAFVAVDQYIDRTFARESSFFGEGMVAHVSMADPVCPRLSALAAMAAREAGAVVSDRGVYLAMEGPQFSSRAESQLYRSWGCDVIGMTNLPEAKLAREAELPYASLAMVTDYDCWRSDDEGAPVEVQHILEVMHANAALAKAALKRLCAGLAGSSRTPSPIDTVLDAALVTAPEHRDARLLAKLDAVAGRVLASGAAGS
jgi:5'-methylthioadenosine phosphorylase